MNGDIGFDLNVPYTRNGDVGVEEAENDDDVFMVDENLGFDVEELFHDELLDNVNVGNDEDCEPHIVLDDDNMANDDDCLLQPIEHVEEENVGFPMENVAEANNLGALSTIVPAVMSTWEHLRFKNQDEFNNFYKCFAHVPLHVTL
ncbi:unnamed protein product [Linum tenue]|uniref:Uncharacterized protein n=1 Tax=Linum tenue TaxID=586396 RepID=A0AAV0LC62_9ROSI|nr:unnamed protein product [Linum tenue]